MKLRTKDRNTLRHDINNQLEIIVASAELVETTSLSLRDRQRLEQIQAAVERVQQLLNDLES